MLPVVLVLAHAATPDDLNTATSKIDAIKSDHLRAGTGIILTLPELNAWVASQLPDGVHNARLKVDAPGVATGTAMVDLAKVSRAKGFDPGWLLSRLLEGDRPVRVTARVEAANGSATVTVEHVEIGGLEIDAKTLEMLVQYVLLPIYPSAVVGKPFEMSHNIDRVDIAPATVTVVIGKPK